MPQDQAQGCYQLLNAEPGRAGLEAQIIAQVQPEKILVQQDSAAHELRQLFSWRHACSELLHQSGPHSCCGQMPAAGALVTVHAASSCR